MRTGREGGGGVEMKKAFLSPLFFLTKFFFLPLLSPLSVSQLHTNPSFSLSSSFLLALAPDALRLHALALARELRRAVGRDREHAAGNARDVVVALARRERQRELAALRGGLGRDGDGVGAGRLGDALLLLADLGDEVAAGGAGLLLLFVCVWWGERKKGCVRKERERGLKKKKRRKRDSERAKEGTQPLAMASLARLVEFSARLPSPPSPLLFLSLSLSPFSLSGITNWKRSLLTWSLLDSLTQLSSAEAKPAVRASTATSARRAFFIIMILEIG